MLRLSTATPLCLPEPSLKTEYFKSLSDEQDSAEDQEEGNVQSAACFCLKADQWKDLHGRHGHLLVSRGCVSGQ